MLTSTKCTMHCAGRASSDNDVIVHKVHYNIGIGPSIIVNDSSARASHNTASPRDVNSLGRTYRTQGVPRGVAG